MKKGKKKLWGVGILDVDYNVTESITLGRVNGKQIQKRIWTCPYYQTWANMLKRCYSKSVQIGQPTYKDCAVCEEWHSFSNFKTWMECQSWSGKELDKDLLGDGKIYSPENCVFLASMVNTFISSKAVSNLPTGVSVHKPTKKFVAMCRNPFTKKYEYLGLFLCPEEAYQVWLVRKIEIANLLIKEQDNPKVSEALIRKFTEDYGDFFKEDRVGGRDRIILSSEE
jgi:hypothetical protein